MYDIAVIGLGPAGSFFVTHLNRKFKVIAIDKKLPGDCGFHKPCGGLLAPDAQKSLSRFNMTLPKDILVSPQIFSVRTIDIKSRLIRNYQRYYINLDRHKFDNWLISHIPDWIEIKNGANCTSIVPCKGGFEITYFQNGVTNTVFAAHVVGADGANSIVRKLLHPNFNIRKYLSIQQWFSDCHETPFYSCIFDESLTDSYAWGLTKDDCFIFGGAFPIKTGKLNFETLKCKLDNFGFKLDNPLKTEACLVLRPGIINSCCGKGVFYIGEAAGFISPSSLEGISYAIDSGYILSQCFNNRKRDVNYEYERGTRKIAAKLFIKTLKRPFMYSPNIRRIIMKSGISSTHIIYR